MAWKVTDYTLQNMKNKSDTSINEEYRRIRNTVAKRVATFEKHNLGNLPHVKAVKMATTDNTSRRMKERAIMDMKRFLNMESSSFTSYNKTVSKTLAYWKDFGIQGLNRGNLSEFYDFLTWVKSFMGDKYLPENVAEAWTYARGDVESAKEFFDSLATDGL